MFETWLKRSGRYQEMIEGELRGRRLPEDLIWVAMIESGFDARAKSPAGAVGLWQFMPATGAVYGLARNAFMDQRKNPRMASQAAAHHLRDLYLRFGAWDLALAAYNMGYEQLLNAIDKYGTSDFNELARQEAIPSETAAYVPKIAAAAIVANNLERFGFDKVEVARPVDAAEIAVPPGTPLKVLAKASGVATSAIRTLNPDILGERVPPGRGDYLVMIPADTVSRARAALPSMLENEPLVVDDAQILDPVSLLGGRELLKQRSRGEEASLLSLLPRYKRRATLRDPGEDLASDDGDREPALERVLDRDRDRDRGRDDDDDLPRRAAHRSSKGRETVMYRISPATRWWASLASSRWMSTTSLTRTGSTRATRSRWAGCSSSKSGATCSTKSAAAPPSKPPRSRPRRRRAKRPAKTATASARAGAATIRPRQSPTTST